MPGPSNARRKKKTHKKKDKGVKVLPSESPEDIWHTSERSGELEGERVVDRLAELSISGEEDTPIPVVLQPPLEPLAAHEGFLDLSPSPVPEPELPPSPSEEPLALETYDATFALLQKPMIHDPGNGPRVQDARAFMRSSFAQPACTSDPLCAEFAQPEVLQMLHTVLPEETALFLWYNKSRRIGRVCPACRRLYNLGDALPLALREQEISGLCSPLCFILASFHCPGAIRSTWGRMAEELDDTTWKQLNTPGPKTQSDLGLSMLLKMTRLHDLGLAQLCTPEVDIDKDIYVQSGFDSMTMGSEKEALESFGQPRADSPLSRSDRHEWRIPRFLFIARLAQSARASDF
ncbi:hypothetical protein EVG20_g9314 [Dentipellis fragilis]|uniref:Uncharacterized protein n=1 Tax=Dentipellis fragilis TaxID=205917 RepID=A0A4Y9Y3U4_9AGAM|nr:hypothetical protein EVG20_g9314 [Dentipellis fragilis]